MTTQNKEIVKLRKLITKHQATIIGLQNTCTHPKETLHFKYHSNTGNYDPSCDSYWSVYDCHLCGKHWIDDQGKFEGIETK